MVEVGGGREERGRDDGRRRKGWKWQREERGRVKVCVEEQETSDSSSPHSCPVAHTHTH